MSNPWLSNQQNKAAFQAAIPGFVDSRHIRSALDAGMPLNGRDDDAAPLQAFIKSLPFGTTVVFPPTLVMSFGKECRVPSGVRLEGNGATVKAIPGALPASVIAFFLNEATYGGPTTTDFAINGFRIIDNWDDSVTDYSNKIQRGIYTNNAARFEICGNYITKTLSAAIQVSYGSSDFTVSGNHIVNRGGYPDPNDRTSGAIYDDRVCIYIASNSFQTVLPDVMQGTNGFSRVGEFRRFGDMMPDTLRGTVENNRVINGTHGIMLLNAKYIKVLANHCENNAHRGIILSPTCMFNSVTGNTIKDAGSTGIHMAHGCEYNTITGNTIDTVWHTEGNGIKAYVGCNHNTITGNTIRQARKDAIKLGIASCYNVVTGNIIDGVVGGESVGILLMSQMNSVRRMFATKITSIANANFVTSACIGNTIQGNTVRFCNYGILFQYELDASMGDVADSKVFIQENTLRDNNFFNCTNGMHGLQADKDGNLTAGSSGIIQQNRAYNLSFTGCTTKVVNPGFFYGFFSEMSSIDGALYNRNIDNRGFHFCKHTATPEGLITAPPGSQCYDTTGNKLYLKASGTGNTGWIVAGTQA